MKLESGEEERGKESIQVIFSFLLLHTIYLIPCGLKRSKRFPGNVTPVASEDF